MYMAQALDSKMSVILSFFIFKKFFFSLTDKTVFENANFDINCAPYM